MGVGAVPIERAIEQHHGVDARRLGNAELDRHRRAGGLAERRKALDPQVIQHRDGAFRVVGNAGLEVDVIGHAMTGIVQRDNP